MIADIIRVGLATAESETMERLGGGVRIATDLAAEKVVKKARCHTPEELENEDDNAT